MSVEERRPDSEPRANRAASNDSVALQEHRKIVTIGRVRKSSAAEELRLPCAENRWVFKR
jgi:hypothetical protein